MNWSKNPTLTHLFVIVVEFVICIFPIVSLHEKYKDLANVIWRTARMNEYISIEKPPKKKKNSSWGAGAFDQLNPFIPSNSVRKF